VRQSSKEKKEKTKKKKEKVEKEDPAAAAPPAAEAAAPAAEPAAAPADEETAAAAPAPDAAEEPASTASEQKEDEAKEEKRDEKKEEKAHEPKRAQRATSNVFALFNQAQIQEFKEVNNCGPSHFIFIVILVGGLYQVCVNNSFIAVAYKVSVNSNVVFCFLFVFSSLLSSCALLF